MISGLLLGVAIGVVSGLVGIGGGALLIPALVFLYGMSQHKAQGTSLATLLLPIGDLCVLEVLEGGGCRSAAGGFDRSGICAGWMGGAEGGRRTCPT